MKLHFISGLPRAGSTLLAAILRQNPLFRAGMSSPVAPIFVRMQEAVSRKNEAASFINDDARRRLLRGVFGAYYGDNSGTVFDTSRSWAAKLPLLAKLFPDAKIICCVRDVRWIVDSIERKVRENPLNLSGMFGYEAGGTVFSRVEGLTSPGGLVGFAINALQEAYYGEHADRLLLVDYEALCRGPDIALRLIYDFIGEPLFEHDFENVEYSADEFDDMLGMPGLHTVRRKVEWIERDTILPPQLFARFANDAFWKNSDMNIRRVPLIGVKS